MTLPELIKQLKDNISPETYARHKQELDELEFIIAVENQAAALSQMEEPNG